MAWTYAALKAADAALGISDLSAATTALNAQATSPASNIAWSAVRDVVMSNGEWGTLAQSAATPVGGVLPGGGLQTATTLQAALGFRDGCQFGGTLTASTAAVWTKLAAQAALLSASTCAAISAASVTAIAALRTPAAPTWLPVVQAGDVQTARAQP